MPAGLGVVCEKRRVGALATERISYLDGWRGLAILIVLIGHFVPHAAPMGSFGVELFFVLSGRLMAQILFEKKTPLPVFFKRRFSRIYPALLALVVSLTMLSGLALIAGSRRGIDPISTAGALTFTINYFEAFGVPVSGTLEHIWSIAVEEHCYALLAIVGLLTARNSKQVVAICLALTICSMANGVRLFVAGSGDIHQIYWRSDVRLAPVLLSAALFLSRNKMIHRWPPMMAGLASLPLYLWLDPLPLKFIVPTFLLAYCVAKIDVAPATVRSALSSRWLVTFGMISYSLYLWQQLFYKMLDGSPVGVLPSIAVAAASYKYVEKPARIWINERAFIVGRFSFGRQQA